MLELSLWLKNFPLTEANALFESISKKEGEEQEHWQKEQAWKIFKYHWKGNPLYQSKVGNCPDNWESIPPIQKTDLQYPLQDIITPPLNESNVYIGNTSGSSGNPFFYTKDKLCHALTWMQVFNLYGKLGINMNSRQARFYGMPMSGKEYWIERLKDFLSRRLRFPVFDLSDAILDKWVQKFSKRRFDYIYGYTSSLVLFAKYCLSKGVTLKEFCPSLKYCLVTSEVCTEEDQKILEKGFGIQVANEYGASEVGIIAFKKPGERWKVSQELLLIETVDATGKQVPYGEAGNILITSLFNKAMPIIRYQIGDIGILEKAENGNLYLKSLEGRTNDFIHLPSGRISPGFTFYYISKSILEEAGFIKEFIVKQTSLDTLVMIINPVRPLSAEDQNLLHSKLDEYLEPGLKLEIKEVPYIKRPESGKIKHFYSEIE